MSFFFFFSSRRRHTRLQGDWSSDVCSSDLIRVVLHDRAVPPRPVTLELVDVSLRTPSAVCHRRDGCPIFGLEAPCVNARVSRQVGRARGADDSRSYLRQVKQDRKSTRLNSSHLVISYAVFCLKKKK